MPGALPKNPLIIFPPGLSVELAKPKFRMTFLALVGLKFNKINNAHIISPPGERFHYHRARYYLAD